MADIDPSGVQLIANSAPADVGIGRGDNASGFNSLAGALSEAEPGVQDFVGQLGGLLQQRAQNKAQADALAQSGEALGQAVRDGKIEPTQNPWYIKAYNQDSAEIRGKSDMAGLLDESQTWAEKNDPQAYQARFSKEMGALAQNYTGHPESLQGFESAAKPIYDQAIAQNQELNVQQINLQHTQDITSLMNGAIRDTFKANPKASPDDLLASVYPLVDKAIGTGFTEPQAKELVFNSILGAAYQNLDPTLLNLANVPYKGGTPLAEIAGVDGKPYGEQLSYAAYRINTDARQQGNLNDVAAQKEGNSMVASLMQDYGYDYKAMLQTMMDPTKLAAYAQAHRISPAGALEATKLLDAKFTGMIGMDKALVSLNSNDPSNITLKLDLHTYAAQHGFDKGLGTRLSTLVAKGDLTTADADAIVSEAASTSRAQFSEGMANRRESMAEINMNEREAHEANRDAKDHIKDQIDYNVATVVNTTERAGDHFFTTGAGATTNRTNLENRVKGAVGAVLAVHPMDVTGAQEAAARETNLILQERRAKRAPPGATTSSPGLKFKQ